MSIRRSHKHSKSKTKSNTQRRTSIITPNRQELNPTNSFENWFNDSKVVDDEGNPLIVYHGTNNVFETFDIEKARAFEHGHGIYFTNNRSRTDIFHDEDKGGHVIEAYLRIENPAIDENMMHKDVLLKFIEDNQVYNKYIFTQKDVKKALDMTLKDLQEEGWSDVTNNTFEISYLPVITGDIATNLENMEIGSTFLDDEFELYMNDYNFKTIFLKSIGHDGIIVHDVDARFGLETDYYIVFEPNQIKSIHNDTFSTTDDRINRSSDQR